MPSNSSEPREKYTNKTVCAHDGLETSGEVGSRVLLVTFSRGWAVQTGTVGLSQLAQPKLKPELLGQIKGTARRKQTMV